MTLSIIIPCLNEASTIQATLQALQGIRRRGHEIILVDGGSRDNTLNLARPLVDKLLLSSPGRAVQMSTGGRHARGDLLWFLHSDTLVPEQADRLIEQTLSDSRYSWGRFDVRLSGKHPLFRMIEFMMNLRSRLTGIATGDQGIFIKRHCFTALDGYRNITLMEDIELSRRLKRQYGRPACIKTRLTTSSRRWEKYGIISTMLLMWRLRLAYFIGVNPDSLKQHFRDN